MVEGYEQETKLFLAASTVIRGNWLVAIVAKRMDQYLLSNFSPSRFVATDGEVKQCKCNSSEATYC